MVFITEHAPSCGFSNSLFDSIPLLEYEGNDQIDLCETIVAEFCFQKGLVTRQELDTFYDRLERNDSPCGNGFEQAATIATNMKRSERGLPWLTCHKGAQQVANDYAQFLCDSSCGPDDPCGHSGNEKSAGQRLQAAGIRYRKWRENLSPRRVFTGAALEERLHKR